MHVLPARLPRLVVSAALLLVIGLSPGCPKAPEPTLQGATADQIPPELLRISIQRPIPVGEKKGQTSISGLRSWILREGTGESPQPGQIVQVAYAGFMTDGTLVDSSLRRGKPLTFTLGAGEVIPGWDQAIDDMKVGELRQVQIPPELGYGLDGGGVMPRGTTLIFDLELVGIIQ